MGGEKEERGKEGEGGEKIKVRRKEEERKKGER